MAELFQRSSDFVSEVTSRNPFIALSKRHLVFSHYECAVVNIVQDDAQLLSVRNIGHLNHCKPLRIHYSPNDTCTVPHLIWQNCYDLILVGVWCVGVILSSSTKMILQNGISSIYLKFEES